MFRNKNSFLLTICSLFILQLPASAEAAKIQAKDCSLSAVQSALNSASDGDVIAIPPGKCIWTSGLTISSRSIVLCGAGMDQTILINNTPGQVLISITGVEGKPFRISGIRFEGTGPIAGRPDMLLIRGTCKNFRIDHCYFYNGGSHVLWVDGYSYGLIDKCTFDNAADEIITITGDEDAAWSRPLTLGTEKAIYVEDCIFKSGDLRPLGHAITGVAGARYVFRHNILTDNATSSYSSPIDMHGNCSTGLRRGGRSYEVYDNTFAGSGIGRALDLRGGDGVVFNNTFSGGDTAIWLRGERFTKGYCSQTPSFCDPRFGYPQCYLPGDYPLADQIRDTYFWNNTFKGNPAVPVVNPEPYNPDFIKLGRDYFLLPKPNYTPYTYPHPFADDSLLPPTDLRIIRDR
jgi:hypothetical protein